MLQEAADALEGLVSVDGLFVFTYEGDRARMRAIYLRGAPRRSGESQQAYLRRFSEATGAADFWIGVCFTWNPGSWMPGGNTREGSSNAMRLCATARYR